MIIILRKTEPGNFGILEQPRFRFNNNLWRKVYYIKQYLQYYLWCFIFLSSKHISSDKQHLIKQTALPEVTITGNRVRDAQAGAYDGDTSQSTGQLDQQVEQYLTHLDVLPHLF